MDAVPSGTALARCLCRTVSRRGPDKVNGLDEELKAFLGKVEEEKLETVFTDLGLISTNSRHSR